MKWMSSRKESLICFVVIIFAIIVLLSVSSCDASAPSKPSQSDTPTPTYMIALAPTDTPTINTSSTETDIPIRPYPTPILVSPAPGATIVGEELTEFSWQWGGALREEEKFDLRIWHPKKSRRTISMPRGYNFQTDAPPDGFGQYLWQVAVVRIDKESGGELILAESQTWPFVWSDVPPAPTSTHTPISTPTPTSTPTFTHTPTATSTPTNTSTPTATPTSTPYYAPTLTAPDNGMGANGTFPPLDWHWDRELGENEYFEVRIWHEDITTYHPALGWVKVPHFDYNITHELMGKYYWTVLVVEGKDAQEKDWWKPEAFPYPVWDGELVRELSPEGEIRYFFYVPPPDVCTNCGMYPGPISIPCKEPPC